MKLDDEVKPKQKPNKSPGYKGNNVCKEVSLEDGDSCGCGCGPKPKPGPPSVLKGDYVQDSHYVHTDNNFTDADKEKLESVEAGAEVNVQADWNETNPSSDAYIKNKPTELSDFNNDVGYITLEQVPAAGTLNTTATSSLQPEASESLGGEIALHKISKTGSYNDILDKPHIPADQVNADWNASSGVAEILNKPTLAAVATSGSYNDLTDTPYIPEKTSDLVNNSGFITQNDVLSYKEFPSGWPKNGTIMQLINAIAADDNATTGMSYMSTVYYSDLPGNLIQGEIQVDIMEVIEGLGKNVKLTLCSSDTSPYHWEYISAYSQPGTWRSFVVNGSLAQVAYSGSYNDLSDKPTIPTALSQLSEDSTHRVVTDTEKTTWNGKSVVSVSDSGSSTTQAKYLTVNGTEYKLASDAPIENISVGGSNVTITNRVAQIPSADSTHEGTLTASDYVSFSGKYTKPANGIPESDLESAVQTSLGKADTALQPSAISDMQTKSNKVNAWQTTPDNDHYPSEKLVKDSLDNKQNTLASQTAYTSQGTSTKVPQITTNTLGQVTGITEVSIDFPTIPSGSGSVTGSATSFVKDVSLSGHTLSGHTQNADSSIDENSASLPTSQAVRSFVNSSISNMAAYYMTKNAAGDPFDSNAELMAATTFYSGGVAKTPTLNDYTIVVHDETQSIEVPGYSSFTTKHDYIGYYVLISSVYTLVTDSNYNTLVFTPGTDKAYELPSTRYINTSETATPSWSYQYIINNTGLTASQIAAVNSGINAGKVSTYDTHVADTTIHVTSTDKTNWNQKLNPVNAVADDTSKNYVSAVTQSTSGQISVSKGTLATVATSGSYNDLINKPSIPAAQVNSDWNASSGLAEILNKPTLAAVATSGSYNDLTDTPTIPATAVLYTSQTLTAEQQAQARANIGAGASGFSGDYADLTNKPVLKTDNTTAQSTSASETITGTINLHKVSKTGTYSDLIGTPSLATVATSGSYNDLTDKPTIPDVSTKANMVNGAMNGNLAGLDSNGDLIDSGLSATSVSTAVTDAHTHPNKTYLDKIPTSVGSNGQVLTSNGSAWSWENVPTELPSQTGQSGKYLTTDGTDMSWATVSGGSSSLSGLTDTTITTPTDGQVLTYDSSSSKWINSNNVDISGKVDKVSGATNGDVAGLDSNGNLTDTGISASDVSTAVTDSHTHSNKSVLDDIPSSLGSSGQVLAVNSGATAMEFKTLSIPAAQVNSDWNANSGVAEILNKPNLATVATSGSYNDLLNTPIIPSAPGTLNTTATTAQSTNSSESLSGNVTLHKVSKTGTYSDLIGTPSLATVATSGSYNDLSNTPTIPGAVTGKTVTLGTTGAAVIQVAGVDSGSVSLPSGSTSAAGIVQLTDSTSSTSTTTAATPNSVKSAYDLASGAIPKSTGTTGGDIIYFTGASTPTRLAKGTAGQVLTMNSGATAPEWQTPSGGGGLTDYNFTHVANTTVTSPFTFTCTANQRNTQMITTGANLTLNITCNNGSDNYLWIKNSSSSADIDVAMGTVTYNGNAVSASSIYLPSDGITVPKSGLCEIGIIMNTNGAFITVRSDLAPSA